MVLDEGPEEAPRTLRYTCGQLSRPTGSADSLPDTGQRRIKRFRADSSVADIRRFILEELVAGRDSAGERTQSVRVTIRVLPDEVEMIVGLDGGTDTSFSAWFVEVLRDGGFTQQAAARRLGVSGKTVNRWVRGDTEPRLRELRRVQAVFGEMPPL